MSKAPICIYKYTQLISDYQTNRAQLYETIFDSNEQKQIEKKEGKQIQGTRTFKKYNP